MRYFYMKLNRTASIVLSSILVSSLVSAQVKSSEKEAISVLQRVSDKLQHINTVSYHFYRDVNYKSESIHNEISGTTFLQFDSVKDTTSFKFQHESETHRQVFDGITSFYIDKNQKTMNVNKQARVGDFLSEAFFKNSILALKKTLPTILAERGVVKTLADTSINKMLYLVVAFTFDSKVINNLGGLMPLTSKRNITYSIVVDKKTYLPVEVIQTNSITPEDYVLTRFSDYKINSTVPAENTWHYFNYIDLYKPVIKNR